VHRPTVRAGAEVHVRALVVRVRGEARGVAVQVAAFENPTFVKTSFSRDEVQGLNETMCFQAMVSNWIQLV
jgi:hypothetical protein